MWMDSRQPISRKRSGFSLVQTRKQVGPTTDVGLKSRLASISFSVAGARRQESDANLLDPGLARWIRTKRFRRPESIPKHETRVWMWRENACGSVDGRPRERFSLIRKTLSQRHITQLKRGTESQKHHGNIVEVLLLVPRDLIRVESDHWRLTSENNSDPSTLHPRSL